VRFWTFLGVLGRFFHMKMWAKGIKMRFWGCENVFLGGFGVSFAENFVFLIKKWLKIDSKMTQKSHKNDPKITQKWPKNSLKIDPKSLENDPKITQNFTFFYQKMQK
jgi:hypothetical protein